MGTLGGAAVRGGLRGNGNAHGHGRACPPGTKVREVGVFHCRGRRSSTAGLIRAVPDDANADGSAFAGMTALVVGATGRTGVEVVRALTREGVAVRALVRDASKGDVRRMDQIAPAFEGCNAVICATGASAAIADPLGPFQVDYTGTCNLVAAAKNAAAKSPGGVDHFVLVSSIGVDDVLFPLNLFWGVLFWKKRAEEYLQRSGLRYTIVRPGGLKDKADQVGAVRMGGPDTYGLPPRKAPGIVLRSQVADCIV